MTKHLVALVLCAVCGIVYPMLFPKYMAIPIVLLLYVGWATAWDLLGGWGGQVSLGHAVFVGVGAYAVAIGTQQLGLSIYVAVLLGMVVALGIAFVWGMITFKLVGIYFAMASIAVAEMVRLIALNEDWLTGGPLGIFVNDLHAVFGFDMFQRRTQFYLALAFALMAVLIVLLISHSRLGFRLRAIAEDQDAAMAAGINPRNVKLMAFLISAALTSLGGSIYGIYLSFIEPESIFALLFSIQLAIVAIVGGRGTVWGPAIGATLLILGSELFRTSLERGNMLVYGLLILFVMLFFPGGIAGQFIKARIRRRYARLAGSR